MCMCVEGEGRYRRLSKHQTHRANRPPSLKDVRISIKLGLLVEFESALDGCCHEQSIVTQDPYIAELQCKECRASGEDRQRLRRHGP